MITTAVTVKYVKIFYYHDGALLKQLCAVYSEQCKQISSNF